jgi:hypothetical protein
LAGVSNTWPFRVAVERVTLVDALTISSRGVEADSVARAREGEKFVLLDVSFESLLPPPKSLPESDLQRGDLRIYTDKLSPDVSVRLGAVRVVGEGDLELFIGAVAPAGQDRFFGASNIGGVAIASDKPKIACRLAVRIAQDLAPKLNALHFGSLVAKLPAPKALP